MKNTFSYGLILLMMAGRISNADAQTPYFDAGAYEGYGFRFWNGDNNYKISMGNSAEYNYGPVTGYSIKTNMVGLYNGWGFTWGSNGSTPIAGLTAQGNMQIAGAFTSSRLSVGAQVNTKLIALFDNTSYWYGFGIQTSQFRIQAPPDARISFLSGDSNETMTLTGAGALGVGTPTPAAKIHGVINSGNTTYANLTTGDISLALSNSSSTNNNFNVMSFLDASGWGVAHVGVSVPSQSNHTGKIFFSTRPTGSGPVQRMVINENGYVGIGSLNPSQMLTVNGTIYGKQVKVDLSVPGPDYVFEESYALPSLDEVKSYIDENKHLPEVPSAREMEAKGIDVGEMNMLLLKKVEELTLYILQQEQRIKTLEERKH